jgi:FMN phosphatase YigB (HAD superfamily)
MTDTLPSILRHPDVTTLTFDCYGTLIDWETGLRGAETYLRLLNDGHLR